MSLVNNLLDELKESAKKELSLDPFSFPQDTPLCEDQSVEPVAATFVRGMLVHIYKIKQSNQPECFISSSHGDGGAVIAYGGPWSDLNAAEASFGKCPEGWTVYKGSCE